MASVCVLAPPVGQECTAAQISSTQCATLSAPAPTEFQPKTRNQYLAALAACFGAIQFGTLFGWTAASLPYLRDDPSGLITSSLQESWTTSIMLIGGLVSGPPGGYCNERFGRRNTMLFLTPLALVSWALIYFAQNVEMIFVARFVLGFVSGVFLVVTPIYIAETSDPDIRGRLSMGVEIGLSLGMLYIEIVGAFAGWKWQTLGCATVVVIGHLLLMIVPETPRYLISKGKFEDAVKSVLWLKNSKYVSLAQTEVHNLKLAVDHNKITNDSKSGNQISALFQPHVLKPLVISLALHCASAFSGITPLSSYTVDIFKSAGTDIDEFLCTVIFGIFALVASILSSLVVDKFGRRPILIFSQIFMTLALAAMGLFYFLKMQNEGKAPAQLQWVPLASLGVFVGAFSCGTGPLAFMIQGEILPPEAKGIGLAVITTVRGMATFCTVFFFSQILNTFGEHGGYWLFSGFCFLGLIFVLFCVPETKGRTLEDIQGKYIKKRETRF